MILTGTRQHKDVELVAQTITDALSLPFQVENQSVQITVSIGVSLYPWDAFSPVALLQVADQAMYKAKKWGHNRMCFLHISDPAERYSA